MLNNYTRSLLFLLAIFSGVCSAQSPTISAVDDFGSIASGGAATIIVPNVLANDTVNGLQATTANVVLTELPNDFPYFSIESDGSVWYTPVGPTNPGVYTITYQISEIGNPNNVSMAYVTLSVESCSIAGPQITNVIFPHCSDLGTIQFTNLPDTGTWYLQIERDGSPLPSSFDNRNLHEVTNLNVGVYQFTITDNVGCASPPTVIILPENCSLTMSFTGTYEDYNSDGSTNVGDVINYQFSIVNNSELTYNGVDIEACCGDTSIAFYGDQLATPFPPGAVDNTTFTGVHILTQEDINNDFVFEEAYVYATINLTLYTYNAVTTTLLNITDGLKLNAFIDSNGNGTQDTGELPFVHGNFEYEINDNGIVHNAFSYGPYYIYESDPANSYTLTLAIDSEYSGQYSTTAAYQNISVAAGSGLTTYNFPVTEIPYEDLTIWIYSNSAPPRPGFEFTNTILCRNNGTIPGASGTITFVKPDAVTITGISIAGTTATPNGFTYDFSGLDQNESLLIQVSMAVPTIPTVALGDLFVSQASVTVSESDIFPLNNVVNFSQVVVGSYDPNDKSESYGGKVVHSEFIAEDYLTYTIRFENTGTANAINVNVNDVLDPALDEATVRMVTASHDFVLDRIGNDLNWRFDGINLPPSVEDSSIGHGYIVFQVKPKPGYAIGDIIPNTADIYFDFNPAIVTNVCTTEFVSTLATTEFEVNDFAVYPNPVHDIVTISSKNNNSMIDEIDIKNIFGKTVLTPIANGDFVSIDLSSLSSGIYFAKVYSAGNEKIIKLIKN